MSAQLQSSTEGGPGGPRWSRAAERERVGRMAILLSTFGLLLLLGVGWTVVSLNGTVAELREENLALVELVNDLNLYQRAAVDLETGQRGLLLTGDEEYLQPFERGNAELKRLEASLHLRFGANGTDAAQFSRLQDLLKQKQRELEMSLAIYREQGSAAAINFVATNVGKALMDEAQQEVDSLSHRLRERVVDNQQRIADVGDQRDLTTISLLALGIFAGGGVLLLLRAVLQGEQRTDNARREAEQATAESREKSAFLANMSHEIRTPMNAIFGFAQLLGDLVEGERERFYVKAIAQSGKSLLALIDDILDMSKIEAGKLELRLQPVDLGELIRSVATMFSQMVAEKGLTLETLIDPGLPRSLLLDPLRVRQILLNLLGNAVKYTDRGGIRLMASSSALDGVDPPAVSLRLQVQDTGLGIPGDQLERIFEPFNQADSGNRAPRPGTGLGLSIVNRLVSLMQGRIEVQSTLCEGSTFSVFLDPVLCSAQQPSELPLVSRLDDLPPLKILVVDDVELNRRLLEGLFAGTDHRVRSASGGVMGVAMAQQEGPQVVLMDIRMPDLDGVSALTQIREQPGGKDIKIIAVTASSLLGEENRLRRLFDGYIRKPISREILATELARLFKTERVPATTNSMDVVRSLDSEVMDAIAEQRDHLLVALQQASATLSSDDLRELVSALQALPTLPALEPVRTLAARIQSDASLFDVVNLELRLAELRALLS